MISRGSVESLFMYRELSCLVCVLDTFAELAVARCSSHVLNPG